MNTDNESLESYLLTLKPSKLPTASKHTLLCKLDTLKQETYRPPATYSYWASIWAVAASLLLLLTGLRLLSGFYANNKMSTTIGCGNGLSLALVSCNTNLEMAFYAGLNHSMHNNVAIIDFPHFSTNSTVQML